METVKARRARKGKTRTNRQWYARMTRRQLGNLLEQERRYKLGSSINTDDSDEAAAKLKKLKQLSLNWQSATTRRATKRKEKNSRCRNYSKNEQRENCTH